MILRRLKSILRISALALAALILFYCLVFWTTGLWFSHSYRSGNYHISTAFPIDNPADLISKTDARLKACDIYDAKATHSIYIFSSEQQFKFFALVAGSAYPSQGFNKHAFGKIYISRPFIGQVHSERQAANKVISYSAMEGDLVEVICHEVVHSFVYSKLGRRKFSGLPTWKQEGYAEYAANIQPKLNDTAYDLKQRVDLYNDKAFWDVDKLSFEYYEAEILVEFLLDIKKMTFDELMNDSFTYAMALQEMNEHRWQAKQDTCY